MTVGKPAVNGIWRDLTDFPANGLTGILAIITTPLARPAARAILFAGIVFGLITGCAETIHTRGNLPDPKAVAEIEPGEHTRAEITRLLGTPSTIATFEREIWFYIGGRVKTQSFFTPDVLERKVLTIQFDKRGVVKEINTFDATKIEKIELVQRKTPTKGKELTLLQQLIGNIGRFGSQGDDDL
jgi:outer membrane protein assembly factor BamE (lipoprotein component of BamABCDE complex)